LPQSRAARGRALYDYRPGHHRLPGDYRRLERLHAAMDHRLPPLDAAREEFRTLRIRVPRRRSNLGLPWILTEKNRLEGGKMMRTRFRVTFWTLALLTSSAIVTAHHSLMEFDTSKRITIRGPVTQMEWVNPHVWLHLDVKG